MILAFLLLLTGLTISGVAIYYSVIGLTAIFSAAVIPIIVMGSALEVAKLVCASWLKANWQRIPFSMKSYMTAAVVVLMLITSMGIFGFLSKAHSDQSLVSGDVQARLAIYDEKIKTARENIEGDRKQLRQLDDAVDQVMARSQDEKGADKSNAIRKSQARTRSDLAKDIEAQQKIIAQLNDERAPVAAENRKVEAEVGPIKYIANFIYGENGATENMLEKAVTWIIILIVVVFDPLAVIMLLASQMAFQWNREKDQEQSGDFDAYVAESHERTIDEMVDALAVETDKEIEQEEQAIESELGTPQTPAYLAQPFDHFRNLTPMPAPHVEPEPKLETTPFDVVHGVDKTLTTDTVDNSKIEHLQTELNQTMSDLTELAAYTQNLQNDYASISDLHQRSITREAELIDENARLKEQLATPVAPAWEDVDPKVLDAYNDERLVTNADKVLIKPLYGQDAVDLMTELGIFDENGKPTPMYGGEAQEEHTPVEVNKHTHIEDTESVEGEPAIQTLGIDVVERPGDYITDPVANLFTRREPKTGFGNNFPNDPERGDFYMRTDFKPSKLFKWNGTRWLQVSKDSTMLYTHNDAYIQFLSEQVLTGVYTWDDLTETEIDQVQTVFGGRRG